jgi:thiamine monophosphate synthase
MRKLETKIRQGLPFGKPFFAFGGINLENGVNQLENGVNKKSCTADNSRCRKKTNIL